MATNTNNYTVGQMRLYFQPSTSVGTIVDSIVGAINAASPLLCNAYDLGNVSAGEITPDITYLDHYVTKGGKRIKDKTVAIMQSLSMPITLDEFSATNLKHFFGAEQSGDNLRVFQAESMPVEGAAVLAFRTDIGRDFLYVAPKCALRTEGAAIAAQAEDWMTLPMTLEILNSPLYALPGSPASLAPYGYIKTTSVATDLPGI